MKFTTSVNTRCKGYYSIIIRKTNSSILRVNETCGKKTGQHNIKDE